MTTATKPKPKGRFSRLDPEQRRRQILDAAVRVFSERGYDNTSTGQIAEAAGVTRGLLHHYFGGKRDLYLAVVEAGAQIIPNALSTDTSGLSPTEVARRNLTALLDGIENERDLWISARGFSVDPELEEILDRIREQVIDRIVLNQTGSTDAPPELRFLLRCFLGLGDTAAREWLERDRASREQVEALLFTTLQAMLAQVLPQLLQQQDA